MAPLGAALVVVAVFLSLAVFCSEDTAIFVSLLFVTPAAAVIGVVLLICGMISKGGRRLTLVSTVAALWLASVAMLLLNLKYDFTIRTKGRWFVMSHSYKAKVLAQPSLSEW